MQAIGLRGLAIALTGVILLAFVPLQSYTALPGYIGYMMIAGITAMIATWGYASATHYYPVGIANAGVMSLQVIVMAVLGLVFFDEHLDSITYGLIAALVMVNAVLSVQRYNSTFAFKASALKGAGYIATNGIFQAISFFLLAKVARELDPFLAAYCWEVLIGLFALIMAFLHARYGQATPNTVTPSRFFSILWRAFPTVPAVALYAYATTLAPVAIVQAVFTSVALFAAMLGALLYQERLTRRQIVGLALLFGLLAALKYQVNV
jgi:drug/metabolite transporter (DMT)-like permease